ncbi:MAG: hypothetical protein LUD12_13285 [Lachnospiraceae bacterium]|nr:hypothetical protein [Lachnospiraceae bacterium]
MTKYIDVNVLNRYLRDAIDRYCGYTDDYRKGIKRGIEMTEDCVRRMPAADVEPVRHGKLTDLTFGEMYNDPAVYGKCNICGAWNAEKAAHYCRNCGAKLDGGSE